MKLLLIYRIALFVGLAVSSPMMLLAAKRSTDKPVRREFTEAILLMFQDSTAAKKKPSKKPQDVQKPPQDVQEDRLREAQKRSIKQVPRSLPKLKPQPVPDRVKIQRPPIKGHRN